MLTKAPRRVVVCGLGALIISGCGAQQTTGSQSSGATSGAPSSSASVTTVPAATLPALAAGAYTSKTFIPGMAFTLSAGSWYRLIDERAVLSLIPVADLNATMAVWLDPYLVDALGTHRPGVSSTPAGFSDWLTKDPNLLVSKRAAVVFNNATPATVLDLAVSTTATNEDATCPADRRPCVVLIKLNGNPNGQPWDIGMAQGDRMRLYVVGVGDAASQRTLVVALEASSPAAFDRLAALAEPVLSTLQLPATLP
jgi:hypothetical protein